MVKKQVINGCMHACVSSPYFVSVHTWKLAVLGVCVALNSEDVMRGAHECVCATACVRMCVSLLCVSGSAVV